MICRTCFQDKSSESFDKAQFAYSVSVGMLPLCLSCAKMTKQQRRDFQEIAKAAFLETMDVMLPESRAERKVRMKSRRASKKGSKPKKKSAAKEAYAEYLSSEHWKNLRAEKAAVEPMICAACYSKSEINCHHMCYRNPVETAQLSDLLWLCRLCHVTYHKHYKGKVSPRMPPKQMVEHTLTIIQRSRPGLLARDRITH